MAVSPKTQRLLDAAATERAEGLKATYSERITVIQRAFQPPLSNAELSIGLGLDPAPPPTERATSTRIGRTMSPAPRNARSHPDPWARLAIDRIIAGDSVICARPSPVLGGRRDVLVCERDEVSRLGSEWDVVSLAEPTPAVPPATPAWDADEADWSGGATDSEPAAPRAPASSPPAPGSAARATTSPPPPPPPRRAPRAVVEAVVTAVERGGVSGPTMRQLADTGWQLSPLGLGGMRLSTTGRPDEGAAIDVIHAALDGGIRLIDTADTYCLDEADLHHNERLIRSALERWPGQRDAVIVATKAGLARPGGRWVNDGRPERLIASCEASREALGVDVIDVFQLHAVDRRVPFEAQLEALGELHARGWVRHVGLSNVDAKQLEQARAVLDVVSVQNKLSLFDAAGFKSGLVDTCSAAGLAYLAYSPLGGHRKHDRVAKSAALKEVAARHGATPYEVALAWMVALSPQVVPLVGATRVESVQSSLRALRLELTPDDLATLTAGFSWASAVGSTGGTTVVPRRRIPRSVTGPDVVMVMGYPASGKTSRVRTFVERGYKRLNRDLVGGRLDDLLPRLADHLSEGHSVVLDNTYMSRQSRAGVIEAAKAAGGRVRCHWVGGRLEDAQYNAALRIVRRYGRCLAPDELTAKGPDAAPNIFGPQVHYRHRSQLQPPSVDEGLDEVEVIPFRRHDDPTFHGHALLLDVDGTLRRTRSGAPFPTDPEDIEILPGRRQALMAWQARGYRLFGVSNQAGVAQGQLSEAAAQACFDRTVELLGVELPISYCPHPAGPPQCWCRKPLPGLGIALIERHRLARPRVIMVGDRPSDAGFARALGVRFVHADVFFDG